MEAGSKTSELPSYHDTFDNDTDTDITNDNAGDYYPEDKIYEIFASNRSSEQYSWYTNLNESIVMLNEKLVSPRLRKLDKLWYSGFEDLELKNLERSILKVRVVVDDTNREDKEFKVWKIQYRHLKDLLCEVDDVLDDIALRAPQLHQLFQSQQVSQHPYLTGKLLQINNLIQELETIAVEIRNKVLPAEFTRSRKTSGLKIHSNQASASVALDTLSAQMTQLLAVVNERGDRLEQRVEAIEQQIRHLMDNSSYQED